MKPPAHKGRVAVVGAGVGGLTCAALLAHAGLAVTVFEKNERVGGKLNWLEADGYNWDTGPSLLTMPYVFEDLWRRLGRRLEDDLTLVPLPVTCRYRWTDGTVIDEDKAFWERSDVAGFLRYARGLYDLSADAFLHHPLDEWWRQLRWSNVPKLRHLPKIASWRTMDATVRRFFGRDPHLVQLFDRFATYNGSSPYLTPAAFNIIAYVEAKFGGWYIKGGMYNLARALEGICRDLGVRIVTGCEVQALGGIGGYHLQTDAERTGPFDTVVCNQDVLSAHPRFLPGHPWSPPKKADPSISAFLLYLGVGKTFPELSHHNIFFSDDYPGEFRQLFTDRRPADEPTIYVAVHSKDDPGRAPAGGENWFVLVNAPALTTDGRVDWPAMATHYGDRVLERLETRFGLAGLRDAVRVRRQFTPNDFETRYLAQAGSLYGLASHGVGAAFQRPAIQPRGLKDFYFVGGSTHPGGGLPLVCLSGQNVADKILRRMHKSGHRAAGR